jgi:arylsulfatase
LIIDIEADPFERTWEDSELYRQWQVEHVFLLVPTQAFAAKFLSSFKEFPQRQKIPSFNLDRVIEQMSKVIRD